MKASRHLFSAAFFALLLVGASAKATTVYALTNGGDILTFDSANPGTITTTVTPDVGVVGAYILLAIDVRPTVQASPANPGVGSLWAIGRSATNYQLFVIDPATGATSAIGVPYAAGINAAPSVNGWGFDFNPSVDRIRLVDNAGDNYRLNPNVPNGVVTATDSNLTYVAGDPNAGTAPQVDAAAYTTSAFAGTTSLYYIDSSLNILAKAVDPNLGTLQTVGLGLTVDIDQPNGFDIFQTLALFSAPTLTSSALYSVDLTSGAATLVGSFPLGTNIRGLAISTAVPVPPLPGPPTLRIFGKARRVVTGTPALVRGQATDDSGVVALSYRVTNRSPSFTGAPNGNPFAIKVRRLAIGDNRVTIRAVDPSGNKTEKKIVIVRRH